MKSDLNLRELAVDRDGPQKPDIAPKRHLLTRYIIPLALLVGFLGLAAWGARDLYLPRQPVTVIPVFASRSEVQQAGTPLFKAAGWVEPRPIPIRVTTLSSGVVEELLVVEDQPVKKGEPVAYLVKEDAELARDKAKAAFDLANAELARAKAEKTAAQTDFDYPVHLEAAAAEAKAALAKTQTALAKLPFHIIQAKADSSFLQEDLQGKKLAGEVVAGIELERAKSKLQAAQAKVDDLKKQQQSLELERKALEEKHHALVKRLELKTDEKKALDESTARVQAAKAQVEAARVTLAEAQLRLDRMTVVAPVAGRVLRLWAAPGTHLAAGMGQSLKNDPSTVVTMYRPDHLQVRVDVRFDDLPQVQRGQPVLIESPALRSPLTGKVLFVSSLADIQKNTLEVKVGIESPPALLKPEMLVDATFLAPPTKKEDAPASEQRLYVPQELVQSDGGSNYVWVADLVAGTARRQAVEVGRPTSNGLIDIVKGLTLASRLIVSGRESVEDGARIQVTGEDTTVGVDFTPADAKANKGQVN